MNAADCLVLPDDHGDVAVICPECGAPSYAPLEADVTIGLLVRLASEHALIHEPATVGRHTAPIPLSDPTATVRA